MNPIRRFWRPIPVLALAVAILIVLPLHAAAVANVPVHSVGDSVGYGVHLDLRDIAQPYLDQLRQRYAADPNTTINALNLTGSFDHWTVVRVTGVTPDVYTIRKESATGLEAHYVTNITSRQALAEGRHSGTIDPTFGFCSFGSIPRVTKTSSARLDVMQLQTASSTSLWNVSDFALRASTTNHTVALLATFSGRNVPRTDTNLTACTLTVTYRDVDYRITVDVNDQVRIAYAPALDVFDFPIVDGEEWYANSTATAAGTFAGSINVEGINPADEKQFFDALKRSLSQSGISVTGLDGFPIVLQEITLIVGAAPYLDRGVLHDLPIPVSPHLRARETTMTLSDGQFHTVYELRMAPASGTVTGSPYPACYYSPDRGFIVGCALVEASTGLPLFELKNVVPGDANGNVETTKAKYGVFSTAGNPLADFFLKPPFLGLLLVAAAAVVVGALLVRRRQKPTPVEAAPPESLAPPRPPPQTP